ncbi:hypothetical protein QJS83_07595 [Bdellovibrio sp. 22V]|uniref:hypothetical protein n=1 Tax=Bdellovibrio sp. 22V TaxID=3044166 RepID=UPI00254290F9|nr:hypothetical protein [Bdellovibrio sp. 22V]WII73738.1 hypothetical protein QJS83_07595 [Bdellovibrio sp. 22V]
MTQTIRHLVAVVFILSLSSVALAEWSSRNRMELGMTDNALLTDTNKESDFFYVFGTRNTLDWNQHVLGLRLGYSDYSKENANDVLSWGLSDRLKCFTDKNCEIELRGQEYVYGEPMTTDSSFSNYGLRLAMEKSLNLHFASSFDLATTYEAKNYYSLGRLDHVLSEVATLGYEVSPVLYLEGIGEAGLALSSASEYSSYFLQISGALEYQLDAKWVLSGELGFKQTSFLSRDLTTETQVTRKNGRVVSQVDTSKEAYTNVFLYFDATRSLFANGSAGVSLQSSQQKSRSGYQDYNELVLAGKFLINY